MNCRTPVFVLLCSYGLLQPTVAEEKLISAEAVVVAIQKGEEDTRLIEPPSELADLDEIYLVRVDHWSRPRKEKYIIVEYVHQRDNIDYSDFDKMLWQFHFEEPTPKANADCHSWMARSKFGFLPTAFGAKDALPNPKELPCFVTTKRPVPIVARTPMR